MNKHSRRPYRSEMQSISWLKTVLTNATKNAPPRVWHLDTNEELALELIKKMKTEHKKSLSNPRHCEEDVLPDDTCTRSREAGSCVQCR